MSSEYTVEIGDPVVTAAGTFRVRVEYDPHSDVNPREDFDQLGTMVCQRNPRYNLPREGDLVAVIDEAFDRGGARLAVRYLSMVHGAAFRRADVGAVVTSQLIGPRGE